MVVINKRGTTRKIEDSQLAEYERKGYKKVEATKKADTKPEEKSK